MPSPNSKKHTANHYPNTRPKTPIGGGLKGGKLPTSKLVQSKTIIDKDGIKTKIKTYPDGTTSEIKKNKDGVIIKIQTFPEGLIIQTDAYPNGDIWISVFNSRSQTMRGYQICKGDDLKNNSKNNSKNQGLNTTKLPSSPKRNEETKKEATPKSTTGKIKNPTGINKKPAQDKIPTNPSATQKKTTSTASVKETDKTTNNNGQTTQSTPSTNLKKNNVTTSPRPTNSLTTPSFSSLKYLLSSKYRTEVSCKKRIKNYFLKNEKFKSILDTVQGKTKKELEQKQDELLTKYVKIAYERNLFSLIDEKKHGDKLILLTFMKKDLFSFISKHRDFIKHSSYQDICSIGDFIINDNSSLNQENCKILESRGLLDDFHNSRKILLLATLNKDAFNIIKNATHFYYTAHESDIKNLVDWISHDSDVISKKDKFENLKKTGILESHFPLSKQLAIAELPEKTYNYLFNRHPKIRKICNIFRLNKLYNYFYDDRKLLFASNAEAITKFNYWLNIPKRDEIILSKLNLIKKRKLLARNTPLIKTVCLASFDEQTYSKHQSFLTSISIGALVQIYKNRFLLSGNPHKFNNTEKTIAREFIISHEHELVNPNTSKLLILDKQKTIDTLSALSVQEYTNTLAVNINKEKFYSAIKHLTNPKSAFLNNNFEDIDFTLSYPLEKFTNDIFELMQSNNLSKEEMDSITRYYGFVLPTPPNKSVAGLVSTRKESIFISNPRVKSVVQILDHKVNAFLHNEFKINGHKNLSKNLNDIFQQIPELFSICGRAQHKTHSYTLEKHTFFVMQRIIKHPLFKHLDASSKQTLIIATLLHDIAKEESVIDQDHPQTSANLARKLIANLPEARNVYYIIKNHDWPKILSSPYENTKKIAKKMALDFRAIKDIDKMLRIFAESDIKSVRSNNGFWTSEIEKNMKKGLRVLTEKIREQQKNVTFLPQVRIKSAGEIAQTKNEAIKIDTSNNVVVVDLNKVKNINEIPWLIKQNSPTKQFGFLIHGVNSYKDLTRFDAITSIQGQEVFSTSYISPFTGYSSYQNKDGFIIFANDILLASPENFGSGYKKDTDLLVDDFYYHHIEKYLKIIPDLIKKKAFGKIRMYFNKEKYDKAYIELCEKIQENKFQDATSVYLETTEKKYNIQKIFSYALKEFQKEKDDASSLHNEILIRNEAIEQIQAVFCHQYPPNKNLLNFARKHNLPIIVLPKNN